MKITKAKVIFDYCAEENPTFCVVDFDTFLYIREHHYKLYSPIPLAIYGSLLSCEVLITNTQENYIKFV